MSQGFDVEDGRSIVTDTFDATNTNTTHNNYDVDEAATKTYYATGWYGPTEEGDRAIYTGELSLESSVTGSLLSEETVQELRLFESLSGNTIRRFRMVDEGPLLPPVDEGKISPSPVSPTPRAIADNPQA